MESSLYPIAVLIEELKSEDMKRRINSIQNLKSIAVALGADRTRKELIPYLGELMDDEEEVLLALAQELGRFIDCIGGHAYAHILFDPLEKLTQVEDVSVQNAAFQSLIAILQAVNSRDLEAVIVDMLQRMATSEWHTQRIGAAKIIPHAIPNLTTSAQDTLLSKLFAAIMRDDHTLVRKAAAEAMQTLVQTVPPEFESQVMQMFGETLKDTDDTVRLVSIDIALAMLDKIQPAKVQAYIVPFIRAIPDDKAWRVRYLFAEKIVEFGEKLGAAATNELLITNYTKFLGDSEPEVRTGSVNVLAKFCAVLSPTNIIDNVIPSFTALAGDTDSIKATLGSNLCRVAPLLGQSATNTHLLPVLLTLLRDENPDVRLSVLTSLEDLKNVIGSESLAQTINPAIDELVDNKNWRVRQQVVDKLFELGEQLGDSYFNTNFLTLTIRLLSDQVNHIRTSVVAAVCQLGDLFGPEWVQAHILPDILTFKTSPNYLQRIVLLSAITSFARFFDDSAMGASVMPVINELASDMVPNVRLNAAKTLKTIYPRVNSEDARMILRLLNRDEDNDVRYFADQALTAAK